MKSFRFRLIYRVALAILMLPLMVRAEPDVSSVSGNFISGEQIQVRGLNFGVKASASPIIWDDFEGGTNGVIIENRPANIGQWDQGVGSDKVRYSVDNPRTGQMSSHHDFVKNFNVSLAKNISIQRLYLDFWAFVDYVDRPARNWKMWRLYGDSDELQLSFVHLCTSRLVARQHTPTFSEADYGGQAYVDRRWYHVQMVLQESSPNQSDGTVRHRINNRVHGTNSAAVRTRATDRHYSEIRIGHYWAIDAASNCEANGGAQVYVDDVYIDSSWARVELGNAPVYSDVTHSEIQLPISWSPNELQLELKPGTFDIGQTVYLFVFDADNQVSAGYPFLLGGSGKSPRPPTEVN